MKTTPFRLLLAAAAVYDGTRAATNYATRNVHFYVDGVQKGVESVLQGVVVASNDAPVVVGNASAARTAGNLLVGNVDDVLVIPGWASEAAGNGNASEAIQCFMAWADDIFPPGISAPGDVEAEAGECLEPVAVELGSPAVWDDCGVASVANDAPAAFGVGETTVTWTATDVAGNTASDTQTVAVWPRGSADCDGDGWSDLEEWEAGTDPGDAASAPSLAKGVLIHAVRYNAAESNQYVQLYNAGRYPVQLDGREFDRMVPFESRGQCTRAIYGGLEATPPNSPLDRLFSRRQAGRYWLLAIGGAHLLCANL